MIVQTQSSEQTLEWEYQESPDKHHQYALHDGDQVVSTLSLEHQKDYEAVAEIDGQRLLFERHLVKPYHIEIRKEGASQTIATLNFIVATTGELQFAEGNSYHLAHHNPFVPEWDFEDEAKQTYVSIKAHFGFGKPSATITVATAAANLPDIKLLSTLLWYVVLMTNLYPSYMLNR